MKIGNKVTIIMLCGIIGCSLYLDAPTFAETVSADSNAIISPQAVVGYWGDTVFREDRSSTTVSSFSISTTSTVSITGSQKASNEKYSFDYALVNSKGVEVGEKAHFTGTGDIQKSWTNVPPGTYKIVVTAYLYDDWDFRYIQTRGNAYATPSN
ncbi:hypothetical protein [Paenibacillus cineris]|uniref:Uncharacterized protein n=1 Tax=Paenibacillus cineris TaxID=237530 RepID=A0ABQ4LK50_9BACL|nr:hypothetical protein [Paenibacillus cineris]GIO56896.1 hypothetical protein J21TS7_52140 [Paenibacillus cineris]